MTNHPTLSTLDDLRGVVIIKHEIIHGIEQLKMFYQNDDGNLEPVRWTTAADNELYSCPLPVVTDTIIPLMSIFTGEKFESTFREPGKVIFERLDYIEAQKQDTHN